CPFIRSDSVSLHNFVCKWVSCRGFWITRSSFATIVLIKRRCINMANGYYLFKCNIVNSKSQSVVAMASYRSDEKLYSLRDGETKNYKDHIVEPESFILTPNNAPSWANNREILWNEVERFENRDNAQLARNVLLSLPNDMEDKHQLELTKEYVQENFVDEGMVADVSIHRDEKHNPHAHVLLTMRPFNEHGEFQKRK